MPTSNHRWKAQGAIVLALLASAGCTTTEVFGWVWANQATAASYTPNATHQYNSSGSTSAVTRSGTGVYQVTFAGLGGVHGGNVQVTARGSDSARCKVAGWTSAGSTVTAGVRCFKNSIAADSEFMASFEAIDSASGGLAYTHYDPPATPVVSVTPDPARSWNVSSIYTPTHAVILGGTVTGYPIEHVTADGTGPDFCGLAADRVTCWNPSGTAVDIAFSYVKGLGRLPGARQGAYAVYDISPGSVVATMTPSEQKSSFTSASQIKVSRLSKGLYAVLVPAVASASPNVLVHVTALDLGPVGAPVHCKPVTWNDAGSDVVVQVACFQSAAGGSTSVDDAFHVSYIVAP
jgi:hypothetical protein